MNAEGASRLPSGHWLPPGAQKTNTNMPSKDMILSFSSGVPPKGPFLCGSLWTDHTRIGSLTAAIT
jgi:hypothetical protein